MRCCAAVGNINCTSDANCTTSNSECNTSLSRCQCQIGFYDGGTYCQPSEIFIELREICFYTYIMNFYNK